MILRLAWSSDSLVSYFPTVLRSLFPLSLVPSSHNYRPPRTWNRWTTCISLEAFRLPSSRQVSHHPRDQWAMNSPTYRARTPLIPS
jgi:hypothetical protein